MASATSPAETKPRPQNRNPRLTRISALRTGRHSRIEAISPVSEHNVVDVINEAPAPVTPTDSAPALSVDHLTKRFGDRTAVDDVSFEVGRGEVFGFLGPNGAGKTTTVRMLGTLIAPTSGSAAILGIPLTLENGTRIRARIAIMPEAPGLYLRLTVRENLEFYADLYETPDPSVRVNRALAAGNVAERADDTCGALPT